MSTALLSLLCSAFTSSIWTLNVSGERVSADRWLVSDRPSLERSVVLRGFRAPAQLLGVHVSPSGRYLTITSAVSEVGYGEGYHYWLDGYSLGSGAHVLSVDFGARPAMAFQWTADGQHALVLTYPSLRLGKAKGDFETFEIRVPDGVKRLAYANADLEAAWPGQKAHREPEAAAMDAFYDLRVLVLYADGALPQDLAVDQAFGPAWGWGSTYAALSESNSDAVCLSYTDRNRVPTYTVVSRLGEKWRIKGAFVLPDASKGADLHVVGDYVVASMKSGGVFIVSLADFSKTAIVKGSRVADDGPP